MKFEVTQEVPVGESLVRVGSVMIPKTFTAHLTEHEDGSPNVELMFEVRDGAPECREVHLVATEDGHEVRCSGLAGIRVQDVLEEALRGLLGVHVEGPEGIFTSAMRFKDDPPRLTRDNRALVRQVREARSARKATITDDLLREVAAVYRANVEGQPTQAVADHFDKSHRTAALYVKRAREAGQLGAAIKGKAGEQ